MAVVFLTTSKSPVPLVGKIENSFPALSAFGVTIKEGLFLVKVVKEVFKHCSASKVPPSKATLVLKFLIRFAI